MKLAFYKGPAEGIWNRLFHWLVCWFTRSRYSHCELVVNGVCWSSSNRDGGVRGKVIDMTTGRWDVFEIPGDQDRALSWFYRHDGADYDWMGLLRFIVPILPRWGERWFCSEAIGAALGLTEPERLSPQGLADALNLPTKGSANA